MIFGAVVLAAGKSERMGQNKLLLPWNGRRLVDNILDALSEANVSEQVVVLGHRAEDVFQAIKPRLSTVKVAVNGHYEEGMTSSFQTGLRVLKRIDAVFLVLGDEPIFDSGIMRLMSKRMEEGRGETWIVSPIHMGKKGHPLLFHSRLFHEILDLQKPQTIRDVVHRHGDRLVALEAPNWTVMDIDTPADYERMRSFAEAGCIS